MSTQLVTHASRGTALDEVSGTGDRLDYEYDFADSWVHSIVVEDAVADQTGAVRRLGGRRAAPPEDCGGIFAYDDLVQAWGSPDHPANGEAGELGHPAVFDR